MVNALKEKYVSEITPSMMKKFNYSSIMEAPKVEKIVLNMGVGDAIANSKNLDEAVEELGLIAGQKPLITKAKKSIATFRLRVNKTGHSKMANLSVRIRMWIRVKALTF